MVSNMNQPPTQPTLLHLRYYDIHIHPDQLKYRGFRARIVRFLNLWRYWLETIIQRILVRVLADANDITDPGKRSGVVKAFWDDVRQERKIAEDQSPYAVPAEEGVPAPRALRYQAGRNQMISDLIEAGDPVAETASKPTRPLPLDEMASRYGLPKKQQRYAFSGKKVVFEEEFETLEGEEAIAIGDPSVAKQRIAEHQLNEVHRVAKRHLDRTLIHRLVGPPPAAPTVAIPQHANVIPFEGFKSLRKGS